MPGNDDEAPEFWQACRGVRSTEPIVKAGACTRLLDLALHADSETIQRRSSLVLAAEFRIAALGPALLREAAGLAPPALTG
jgi:hypothetical protein